jgi:hypothetical protein
VRAAGGGAPRRYLGGNDARRRANQHGLGNVQRDFAFARGIAEGEAVD